MFGAKIPAFNIKGQTKVVTATGGILSSFLLVVFIGYALIKLTHLVDKKNPLIAEMREKNFYDYNTRISLKEIGFKIAFSIENYLSSKIRDDPRYVKVLARVFYKIEGRQTEKILTLHKCT